MYKLKLMFLLVSGLMSLMAFQNCASEPAEFITQSSSQIDYESASFLLSPNQIPKISGFDHGPKPTDAYACSLQFESHDMLFAGSVSNRVVVTGLSSFSGLFFEIVTAFDSSRGVTHLRSAGSTGGVAIDVPTLSSHGYYFVRVINNRGQRLCATSAAVIRKPRPACSLSVQGSAFSPGQKPSFFLRHNLGPGIEHLEASWVTQKYNVESKSWETLSNGLNIERVQSAAFIFDPAGSHGLFKRQLILRNQNLDEACRTQEVSFRIYSSQEVASWSVEGGASRDNSSTAPSTGGNSSPGGGSSGGSTGGGDYSAGPSPEERDWCQPTEIQVPCNVTRTYCEGTAPYQREVRDEYPVRETLAATVPKGQRAEFQQNKIQIKDASYRVLRIRSTLFCNPDNNPQWDLQTTRGFALSCDLEKDLRPAGGCDSSGFDSGG